MIIDVIAKSVDVINKTYKDKAGFTKPMQPETAYLVGKKDGTGEHYRYVTDENTLVSKQASGDGGGTPTDTDTYITTITVTLEDLVVFSMEEVTDELVATYINSLGLVKGANEIYEVEITQSDPLGLTLKIIDLTN